MTGDETEDDEYQFFATYLTNHMRRLVPPRARVHLELRGPEIETGGPVTEIAITWEAPEALVDGGEV